MELKSCILVLILTCGLFEQGQSLFETPIYNELPSSDIFDDIMNDKTNIDDTDMWIDPAMMTNPDKARTVFGIYTDDGLRILNDKFVQTFIVPKFDRLFDIPSKLYPQIQAAGTLLETTDDNVIKDSDSDDVSAIMDKDILPVNQPVSEPLIEDLDLDFNSILQFSRESFPNLSNTDKIHTKYFPKRDAHNEVVMMPSKRYFGSSFHSSFNNRPSSAGRRVFRDLYGRNELKRNRYFSRSRLFDPLASRIIG